MSRTEGILLPRLPTTHTRVTSPASIQPTNRRPLEKRARSFSEPHHTAYIGTPRQDVPSSVYFNAVQFDDVFDKEGKLLGSRNTPKITCPLNALEYNSLHDPHCRRLFLNNGRLREHLMNLGLITNDLKVVATTKEQRQKIRAHELLERKEQLLQKMERREEERLHKLQNAVRLPTYYADNLVNSEARRMMQSKIRDIKLEKSLAAEEERKKEEQKKRVEERRKLKAAIEEAQLHEQAKRNAAVAEQEMAELAAYEKQYGKYGHLVARWHRDSDIIHNRMAILEHTKWARMRHYSTLEESQAPSQSPTPDIKPRAIATRHNVPPATPPASPLSTLPLFRSGTETPKTAKPINVLPSTEAMVTKGTPTGGPLENRHTQLGEPEFHEPRSKPNDMQQPLEVLVQTVTVPVHHHRSDPPAPSHHQGDDLTPPPPPQSVAAPTQIDTTGLGTAFEGGEEPPSQVLSPPRSGRLSVIEEGTEVSESGEQPGGLQESPRDIQENPGGAQESPGGAQESPELHHFNEQPREVRHGDLETGQQAWAETQPQTGNEKVAEVPVEPAPLPELEHVILERDQTMVELTRILTEALEQADPTRQGFITSSDFGQVLGTLGLDLDQNEISYITEEADVYRNGWIPFLQVTPYLPEMLMTIYAHRAELEMQQFGAYTEEQWCQIFSPTYGELFLSKITGAMQNWRPDNFRPFLKDDVFEDSVVQYFHKADTNGDGEVDDDEFRSFLMSPDISQSIYQSQMQELYDLSHSYSTEGKMSLEIFAVVARSLIMMIYQNTYPSEEEWIRLQSRKFGDFSLNKRTGEVVLAEPSLPPTSSELTVSYTLQPPPTETETAPNLAQPKAGKKTKNHRKKKASPSDGSPDLRERAVGKDLTSPPPPLLRKRVSKVNEGASENGPSKAETRPSGAGTVLPVDATPQPMSEVPGIVQESTVPLQLISDDAEVLAVHPQSTGGDNNDHQTAGGSDNDPQTAGGSDNDPQTAGGSDNDPQTAGGSDNDPQTAGGSDNDPQTAGGSDNDPHPQQADGGNNDPHPQQADGGNNDPHPQQADGGNNDPHPQLADGGNNDPHPQLADGGNNDPHPQLADGGNNDPQTAGGSDPHPQTAGGSDPHPQTAGGSDPHPQTVGGGDADDK